MAASSTRRTSGALYPFPLKGGSTSTLASQGVKSGRDGRSCHKTSRANRHVVIEQHKGLFNWLAEPVSRQSAVRAKGCQNSSRSQSTTCGTKSGCAEVATKLRVMRAPWAASSTSYFYPDILRIPSVDLMLGRTPFPTQSTS
jgi:hypothetical protein